MEERAKTTLRKKDLLKKNLNRLWLLLSSSDNVVTCIDYMNKSMTEHNSNSI